MADERVYNDRGEVISGYLSPDEAREQGVQWAPRPNEPAPYLTEDEANRAGVAYVPEAQHKINVGGNYDYYQNIDRYYQRPSTALASQITTLGASAPASYTPTVGPVGLAYPDDPVNYATGQIAAANGYVGGIQSGVYPPITSGAALTAGAMGAAAGPSLLGLSPTMTMVLLGGAALAAFFLLRKK